MFGSRLLYNNSTDSANVYSFGNCDSRTSFSLVKSNIFAPWRGSSGPAVVYALRWWPTAHKWLVSYAWTFSEQVTASIINDSRCGMSDVAFRSAKPIGGLPCTQLTQSATVAIVTLSTDFTSVLMKNWLLNICEKCLHLLLYIWWSYTNLS